MTEPFNAPVNPWYSDTLTDYRNLLQVMEDNSNRPDVPPVTKNDRLEPDGRDATQSGEVATKKVEPNVRGSRVKGGLSTMDVKLPQKANPTARKPALLVGISILGSVFLTILLVVALAVPN